MIQYDPSVIQTFADRLYARASGMTLLYGLVGGVVGILAGLITFTAGLAAELSTVTGIILFALGVWIGHERGFALRLQAQQALCLVKTEEAVRWLAINRKPLRPEASP